MKYGSVCSGIEAATQAWAPLGWKAEFFSEIDKFPSAVLAHHYGSNMPGEQVTGNGIPNYGDMKEFERWPDHAIDILVGGTPCQDYSVAGLRAGMAGDRGSLTLTYIEIAARYRPRWIVWENVPGVLSSNSGKDFARFLGDISGTKINVPKNGWKTSGIVAGDPNAYGLAYRVLDTQYVRTCKHPGAIPQRRRRVFVVGYLGDWRSAAAVLLDPESLRRDLKPIRKAGQGFAGSSGIGVEGRSHWEGSGCHPSLNQSSNTGGIGASNQELFSQGGAGLVPAVANLLTARMHKGINTTCDEGKTPLPIAFTANDNGRDVTQDGVFPTIRKGGAGDSGGPICPAIAYSIMPMNSGKDYKARETDVSQPIMAGGPVGGSQGGDYIAETWAVRRLTPVECERLQGFPEDFTRIPWGKKTAEDCPDGHRYKALGNSMSTNVMLWIGVRIEFVEGVLND